MSDDRPLQDLLLSQLADEFVGRIRRGEWPSVTEYVARHSDLADDLRDLLPTMAELEQVKERVIAVDSEPSVIGTLGQWGDLIIRREIGRGGMGIVYEAEQVSLGRLVAVKVLPRSAVFDPIQKRRFDREARAAGRLHHTNIVPVFGVGEHEGLSYFVMQLIDGQPLSELLQHSTSTTAVSLRPAGPSTESPGTVVSRPTPDGADDSCNPGETIKPQSSGIAALHLLGDHRQLAEWIAQVADALDCAHRQGILHRDVKPSNLLIDRDGHIWITDFGLAKAIDQPEETRTGDLVGTVRYLPPEAFAGQRDERGDIYSLGLTLYELLAQRPAFEETDHSQLLRRVTTTEPLRLDKRQLGLPRDLVTIVQKAIEREPGQRYASAAELADDLRRWLRDEPIFARRPSTLEQLVRWRRRHPGVAALLALILLILIGVANVAGIAAWRFKQLAGERETARDQAVSARNAAENNLAEANRQREQAEAALYHGHIAQAYMHYRVNSFDKAEQALRGAAPSAGQTDRRGWEWHYLNTLFQSETIKFDGHQSGGRPGWISALAFSPDGQRLAVGTQAPNFRNSTPGMHSDLRVYDLASGQCRHDLGGASGNVLSVHSLCFAEAGRRLDASTFNFKADSRKKSLLSWDLTSGQATYRHDSADDWQLADDDLARWTNTELTFADFPSTPPASESTDMASAALATTWSVTQTDVLACRAVPDEPGHFWVLARNGELTVWDAATQQRQRTVGQLTLPPGGGTLFALFSPDGRIVAVRRIRGHVVEFWNTATVQRRHIHHDANRADVLAWAFSADSQLWAYGSYSHAIHVLDTQQFDEQVTFRSYHGPVSALTFRPDGRQLAGGDWTGTVKVWDVARRPEYTTVGSKSWPVDLAWQDHSNPSSVVTTSIVDDPASRIQNIILEAWDVSDSRLLWRRTHPWAKKIRLAPGREHMFDARGERILHINHNGLSAGVVDVRSGERLPELTGHQHPIHAIALSSDGQRAVTAAKDLTRPTLERQTEWKVWDVVTGRVLVEHIEPESTLRLAISPDNRLLATTGTSATRTANDTTVRHQLRIWDLETTTELWHTTNDRSEFANLTFRHDSQELATIDDHGLVTRWNTRTGQPVFQWQSSSEVAALAYSPDGHRLAGASRAQVSLWDPTTGHETLTLPLIGSATGSAYVPRLAFSSDGHHLAATHSDGRAFVWKATPKSQR